MIKIFQSTLSARRATLRFLLSTILLKFQSTLSARRATFIFLSTTKKSHNFNPRSPRGERLSIFFMEFTKFNFNPRSPRGERHYLINKSYRNSRFQSTLSARRATTLDSALTNATNISIHALREESDFNVILQVIYIRLFQSTLSARRATDLFILLWE